MKVFWKIWAKALGSKEGDNDREADKVAFVRTFIIIQGVITNLYIVLGIFHHWSDK